MTGAAGAATGAATGAGMESIAKPCERISASRAEGALRTATGFKPCDLNKAMRAVQSMLPAVGCGSVALKSSSVNSSSK